jgi:predicted RNA-binding protein associated with RNAse of E/G family
MTKPVTIHKLDEKGIEVWKYRGVILSQSSNVLIVEAFFDRDDVQFHGIVLRKGDRFIETFYSDRWYNIFTIYDVESDELKGWYCNVCRPARFEDGHVFADDLALDLLVYPDGNWLILDEDEFVELEISQEDTKSARDALNELIDLARNQLEPFKRK